MGYTRKLLERQEQTGRPVRVGLVGAGQMGSGFVVQLARQTGVTVSVVADVAIERAETALTNAGIQDVTVGGEISALAEVIEAGGHAAVADIDVLTALPVDIVVECSGVPEVATQVALSALTAGKDVALMTVEADVTVGLALAALAESEGRVYTVCRGDEPVECLKLIEFAEDLGLEVVMAGKGKNNPLRQGDTPDDLIDEAAAKGMNPKMLCSFVDGTKTMIEMAALANAADMELTQRSMIGPEATVETLAKVFSPQEAGGVLDRTGVVDYCTGNVAPGVFVIVRSDSEVVSEELRYLKLGEGPYFALYRPFHLASIEAPLSIAEAVIDGDASLQPVAWRAEVTAIAKRALAAGERIDGIGGFTVYGDAVSADEAAATGELPIGLAGGATLVRDVAQGVPVRYEDVELDAEQVIVRLRRLQDAMSDGELDLDAVRELVER